MRNDMLQNMHKFWHRGIVTEAGKIVIEQVKKDGGHILRQPITKIIREVEM